METDYAASSDSDFELPGAGTSAWAKLKAKVRKTFCLQLDIQHNMYLAHKREKKSRARQIHMMRALQLEVSSGSEKDITSEEKWISQNYSRWTDSDDTPPPTVEHSPPPQFDDDEIQPEHSEDPVDPSDSNVD